MDGGESSHGQLRREQRGTEQGREVGKESVREKDWGASPHYVDTLGGEQIELRPHVLAIGILKYPETAFQISGQDITEAGFSVANKPSNKLNSDSK